MLKPIATLCSTAAAASVAAYYLATKSGPIKLQAAGVTYRLDSSDLENN